MLLASLWLTLAAQTAPTPPVPLTASDAPVFAAVGAGTVAAVGATAVVVFVAAQPDFGVLALMGGAVPLGAYVGGALGAHWGGGDDEQAAVGGALFGIGGVIVGGLTGAGLCLALSRAPDPLTVAIGAAVVGTGGAAAGAWFGTFMALPSQHTYDKLVVEALRVLAPLAHSSLLAQPAGAE